MTVFWTLQGSNRPRLVQETAILLGPRTVLDQRVIRNGCWEVDCQGDDALAGLLSVAYGKAFLDSDSLVSAITQAAKLMRATPFRVREILDRLPEPSAAGVADLEAAERLLHQGVAPADLRKALRHAALNLLFCPSPPPGAREKPDWPPSASAMRGTPALSIAASPSPWTWRQNIWIGAFAPSIC